MTLDRYGEDDWKECEQCHRPVPIDRDLDVDVIYCSGKCETLHWKSKRKINLIQDDTCEEEMK